MLRNSSRDAFAFLKAGLLFPPEEVWFPLSIISLTTLRDKELKNVFYVYSTFHFKDKCLVYSWINSPILETVSNIR